MKYWVSAAGALFAFPLVAQEVGIPAGCELRATMLMPNCEMHQVLHCEGDASVRTDIYADGVFKGEELRAGLTSLSYLTLSSSKSSTMTR